ncbi:SWIM-type domain-containing protein [Caerostris extrusa]|uniref:SWIM-type domain-containing protein n=1 Tax=Caerostris extrusa TaxID=172846 RepID=A0AAV4T1V9_CAEEX|nr:SWIM-type domain-containing protein [Caerostris extrusa]
MFSKTKLMTKSSGCASDDVQSDFKSLFAYLEEKFNAISEYLLDANGFLSCIYFQDSFMKDFFNFYPDRLCIDVSFKSFETDIFMYLFSAEDSNGKNDVISLGFTVSDNAESFLWLLNTFKKNNPNWRRIKIISLDSEIKQRDIIRNVFQGPYIIITLYHALKSFKKGLEVINEQNNLPIDQIQTSVELFKNLYIAHRPAEYELYYQQFMLMQSPIVSFFEDIWLPIQNQWRTGLDFNHENVFSSLNSHLEYLDNTIKFNGMECEIPSTKTDCHESNSLKSSSTVILSEPVNSISHFSISSDNLLNDQSVFDLNFKPSTWNFKSRILDGKYINYAYLCRIICDTKESCLDWLKQMELIPSSVMCPSCNCEMVIKYVPRLSDGAVWVCSNMMVSKRNCSRRCSVRQGSWFELTNMTFEQILTFSTYISWNKLNRRVCEEVLSEEGKISNNSKNDSSEVLEMWLKSCGDEDSFLKFLQDANMMHRKDSLKRIMR